MKKAICKMSKNSIRFLSNYFINSSINEDVKHAILLRREKDRQTDFYRKLQTLNDRITVYKELFMSK